TQSQLEEDNDSSEESSNTETNRVIKGYNYLVDITYDNGKSKPKVSKSTVSKRKSRLIVDDNDNNKNYISNKKEN
ncbi:15062_t:CDS:2, partial [Entrophospora sp. SA101]